MAYANGIPFLIYAISGLFLTIITVNRLRAQPTREQISSMKTGHWWAEHLLTMSRLGLIILGVSEHSKEQKDDESDITRAGPVQPPLYSLTFLPGLCIFNRSGLSSIISDRQLGPKKKQSTPLMSPSTGFATSTMRSCVSFARRLVFSWPPWHS